MRLAPLPYRRDIDGLRAIAVLLVVWFHAFPDTLRGGFVGVDVFFVISGYLISGIVLRQCAEGQFSLGHFYAQRVRRLFPALLLMFWGVLLAGWLLMLPGELQWLAKHVMTGAGFVQNLALQQEAGYFDVASHLKPLLHLWSLAIEEQFYLVYPLLVWWCWKGGQRVLGTVLAVAFLVSLGWNLYGVRRDMVQTFFWPHTRVWELLAGGLLACFQWAGPPARLARIVEGGLQRLPTRWRAALPVWMAWAGLGLIVLAALRLTQGHPYPGIRAVVPVLGAVLIIASGPQTWLNRYVLGNGVLVGIGRVSYPLYLWHWPALAFVALVAGEACASALWRSWAVLAALLLSILTYHWAEKPLRHGRRPRAALWGLVAALLLTVGAAAWIYQREGVPSRFPLASEHQTQFDRWEWNSQEACFQRYPQFQGLRYCNVSGPGAPRLALIGDSHANHYFPGLAEQGASILNVGHNGCLAFGTVSTWSPAPKPQGSVCSHQLMDQALQGVLAMPSVQTVIFTARYQQYFDMASLARLYVGDELPPDTQGNPRMFERALRQALGQVQAAGKRAVVLLDNPDPLLDPKLCMHDKPAWRRVDPVIDPCEWDSEPIVRRHSGYRALIEQVRKDYPQVTVVDPFPWFCDDAKCRLSAQGRFLFRDLDHLSLDGSRWAASRLLSAIER